MTNTNTNTASASASASAQWTITATTTHGKRITHTAVSRDKARRVKSSLSRLSFVTSVSGPVKGH
jgi:hypothetical protein